VPAERLTFDEDTKAVILDGRRYPMENRTGFILIRFLWEKTKLNQPALIDDIKNNVPGLKRHNAVPHFVQTLPRPLQDIIRLDHSQGGRYIVLPLEK
jgi:hypothetical protein